MWRELRVVLQSLRFSGIQVLNFRLNIIEWIVFFFIYFTIEAFVLFWTKENNEQKTRKKEKKHWNWTEEATFIWFSFLSRADHDDAMQTTFDGRHMRFFLLFSFFLIQEILVFNWYIYSYIHSEITFHIILMICQISFSLKRKEQNKIHWTSSVWFVKFHFFFLRIFALQKKLQSNAVQILRE